MIELLPYLSTASIAAVIFILFFVYRLLTQSSGYWEKQGVRCFNPSLRGYFSAFTTPLHKLEQELYSKFGRIYGRYDGPTPVLTVGDPDLLKNILVKDFNIFQNRRDCQFGEPVMDNNVSLLTGEDWKRVRSVLTPIFTSGKLRKMMSKVNVCVERRISSLTEAALSESSVDLESLFGAYALDVIASCAFGAKINSLKDPGNPFVTHAKKFFASGVSLRAILSGMFPFIMKFFRISMLNPSALHFFRDFTMQIVEERKKSNQPENDFIQLLLHAERNDDDSKNEDSEKLSELKLKIKSLSHDELAAQCVLFFLAGYDTTSSLLQCTLYNLASNEKIQERLFQEMHDTIGEKETIEYDDIMTMKYLDAVVSEALRLSTGCIRMDRKAEDDYKLGFDGIVIKKGQLVSIPIYCIHHDPEWYPNPHKFDPERFSLEAKASRHPFVYLPFGIGPRSCVGNRFALMEAKLCLVTILRKFKVLPSPEMKGPLEFRVKQGTMVPIKSFVKIEHRKNATHG